MAIIFVQFTKFYFTIFSVVGFNKFILIHRCIETAYTKSWTLKKKIKLIQAIQEIIIIFDK